MNYNDNSACLEVLEGSGLFFAKEFGYNCKNISCYSNRTPTKNDCNSCDDLISESKFQPPTSDQAFEILVDMTKSKITFSFGLDDESLTVVFGFPRMANFKWQEFTKGPLSQRLTAALAWLVINKPEELRGVVGGL